MRRIRRALSLLLTAALLASLCLPAVQAADAAPPAEAAGRISATLRIDYAQSRAALAQRGIRMELLRGETSLGSVPMTQNAETTLGGYAAAVTLRDEYGGAMDGTGDPAYLDVAVDGLPRGSYTLRFTGTGYRPFVQTVTLDKASQHVILGTGDATFTLGDLDGDGQVTEADRTALSAKLRTQDAGFDLNGDGRVDIIDLAYVTRSAGGAGTKGEAEVYGTALLAPVDAAAWQQELTNTGTKVEGSVADLLREGGASVTFRPNQDGKSFVIPVPLAQPAVLEAVQIATPDQAAGRVRVDYEGDGDPCEYVEFDNTLPAGVHAVGRSGESRVIVIPLGNRLPVKKVTISVEKTENGYLSVESIRFLQDIVPETPVAANNMVKNLRAVPGSEKVTLRWDPLPNVTGYVVSYSPEEDPASSRTMRADGAGAAVTGLENMTSYAFTVTPTAEGWSGKPAAVTATPMPDRAPAAPDMVTVTPMDSALRVGWKKAENAGFYEVYYAAPGGQFRQYGGRLLDAAVTVDGLENDVTYSLYVVAGNDIGKSGPSRTYEGTPERAVFDRPEGIPAEGVLDYRDFEKVWLQDGGNVSPSSYTQAAPFQAKNMYDGDYATHWTSQAWGDGNFSRSKTVLCTFKTPQDIGSVLWVPRLDGGYPSNLKAYTVTVWLDGEDLDGAGHLLVPGPDTANPGDVRTWFPVQNNPAVTKFAVLPIEPTQNVKKIAVTIDQQGYTAVSLSELLFLRYDENHRLPDDIAALFRDELRTALRPGVTQAQIDALRTRLESDEKNYYLHPAALADELTLAEELLSGGSAGVLAEGFTARSSAADSRQYGQAGSDLQPLGVAAKAGEEITIYAAGIPEGAAVTVYASQFNAEVSAWRAGMGTLRNGRNLLTVPKIGSQNTPRGGSLYLTCAAEGAENIRLHIRRATDIPMLELADWYGMTETARRAAIDAYLTELRAYAAKAGVTDANQTANCLNVTEISLPTVLLSLPARAVQSGAADAGTLYDSILAWEDLMHVCKTTQGIEGTYENNGMTSRQNIRCMQMFAGAFMYAAGNHIGIGYGSCAGMVRGTPIAKLPANASANGLFGWGIAHEIGHNMDKLGRAEITNNIYAIMAQTYDGGQGLLPSRLEKSGKYAAAFAKAAEGWPGASNDVFVQLAMYWQLHLAYDDRDPMDFYSRFFRAWKSGQYTQGVAAYDDRVALTAAGVAGKDLTEFFTRWGMRLDKSTLDTLKTYGQEPRAVWYLSDQSRRERLQGTAPAAGTFTARAEKNGDTQVVLTMDRSGVTGTLQGFEILRNGTPIGFTAGDTYTDVIQTANHRTYEYTVRAVDILGNYAGAAVNAGQVRIAYDAAVPAEAYTLTRDGTTATFTLAEETAVSGIKLTGTVPAAGAFTVTVTDAAGRTVTARTGDFGTDNQAVDEQASFLAYLRKPGTADSRIWTYDAKTVTVTGVPAEAAVQLISYAGDDVALLSGGFAGRLERDYVYGDGADDKIAAGTLVIAGTYRGDPVYNGVKVRGRFTVTKLDESGEPVTTVTERDLDGYSLLFAEIPADGAVSDISDGIFIFVPNVQKEAALQETDPSHCDGVNLLPSQLQVQLFRTDDPDDAASKRTTAETLWVSAPGGDELPTIRIEGGAAQ